ncbi:MAG: hypothetical protein H6867_08910 [Rhodospirillales bacterium]|nr:hypothetical protein [Rhodospirillales bacterium]MCB9996074.1 hypothetical protein [Rhodospirillales bacterium]
MPKTKNTKGWSERRRKRQACNARRNKPWKSATGPKTAKGKEASRMNALKHGYCAAGYNALRKAFRLNREFIRHILAYDAVARELDTILLTKRTEEKTNKIKGDSER